MEHLLANLSGTTRTETLNGREYLVASATLIVPGILNGSQGPVLYTQEEIARDPSIWNGVPLVYRHPYKDGQPVSARNPEILNESGLGYVFQANANGNLTAELWFDIQNTNAIDSDLLVKIRNGEKVELSTGLFATPVKAEANSRFNNQVYDFIATQLKADHLAILTEEIGACSVKKGCGVNNSKVSKRPDPELVDNVLTHGEIRSQLTMQLQGRFNTKDNYTYVEDVTKTSVIFENDGQLLKLDYTTDKKGVVTLSDDTPVKVRRQIDFVTANIESGSVTTLPQKDEAETMKKKELIDNIITNGCGCYEEGDRNHLETFSEERLQKVIDNSKSQHDAEELLTAAKKGFTDPGGTTHFFNEETKKWEPKEEKGETKEESVMNSQGVGMAEQPKTMEEFLASAPPEVVELLNHAKKLKSDEKDALITRIVNAAPEDQRESLRTSYAKMMIEDLKVIANAIPETQESTAGLYGETGGTNNSRRRTPDEQLEVLRVPTMNWN